MADQHQVLVLGGTGRTGQHLLRQLLARGQLVRAIVRSPNKLPPKVANDPRLSLAEADLLSLRQAELADLVGSCTAVFSCLGHVTDFKGVFGPPRDLVWRATANVVQAIETLQSPTPIRFILLSSVSVLHPAGLDTRPSAPDRIVRWALRGLVPPARDNQRAADFLFHQVGVSHPFVQWAAVRPDTLVEGGITDYAVHAQLVNSLFRPGRSSMPNVAHFMCELATQDEVWQAWRGRLPVIVDAPAPPA